ncbi:hypothetical protein ACHAWF_008302 [Thalassiosira exigua]
MKDDLRVGKSCIYRHRNDDKRNPWFCQECSHDNECETLKRHGKCRPFPRYLGSGAKDEIPRVHTSFSPFTRQKSTTLVYHHDGHEEYAKEYPICALSLPCFDLSRCKGTISGPLSVYSHGGRADGYLDFAVEQHPELVKKKTMKARHAFWPFNSKADFGMAAISRPSIDDSWLRSGYDTPLALLPKVVFESYSQEGHGKYKESFRNLDIHRPRKYLLSFKGNIQAWEQRSWQHRWIAAEYWAEEKDVHVNVKCEVSGGITKEYEQNDPDDYEKLILNSTFFFCPGGGGVNSFRFSESLLAGAIPVVTSDFLPPFSPDFDWSGCIVQVSDARVVDIPRIVREMSATDVRKRQQRCARLIDAVFGQPPDPLRQMFSTAMKVWHIRVRNALKLQHELESLIPTSNN